MDITKIVIVNAKYAKFNALNAPPNLFVLNVSQIILYHLIITNAFRKIIMEILATKN